MNKKSFILIQKICNNNNNRIVEKLGQVVNFELQWHSLICIHKYQYLIINPVYELVAAFLIETNITSSKLVLFPTLCHPLIPKKKKSFHAPAPHAKKKKKPLQHCHYHSTLTSLDNSNSNPWYNYHSFAGQKFNFHLNPNWMYPAHSFSQLNLEK